MMMSYFSQLLPSIHNVKQHYFIIVTHNSWVWWCYRFLAIVISLPYHILCMFIQKTGWKYAFSLSHSLFHSWRNFWNASLMSFLWFLYVCLFLFQMLTLSSSISNCSKRRRISSSIIRSSVECNFMFWWPLRMQI